jgi:hypothetical protein
MPIQINQIFPRCQLCGTLLPLRTIAQADGRVAAFCSDLCQEDYRQRLRASGDVAATARGQWRAAVRRRP